MRARTHTHTLTQTQTDTHTYIDKHTHTNTHTYTDSHINPQPPSVHSSVCSPICPKRSYWPMQAIICKYIIILHAQAYILKCTCLSIFVNEWSIIN